MASKKVATNLKKKLWSDKKYYSKIASNEKFDHPGLKLAQLLGQNATSILDVGCGDGDKLARLGNTPVQRYGCEVSREAVLVAKKKHPQSKFKTFDGQKFPYKTNQFDLVVSFFVLEHTQKPERLLLEMLRVCRIGGHILLVAPNFGSPNRASPPFAGSRQKKLINGLLKDLTSNGQSLNWESVNPLTLTMKDFAPDYDTTIEPYLGSLIKFFTYRKEKVVYSSSCWEMELPSATIIQKIFSILGKGGIWPFTNWGPHLVIAIQKK